MKLEVRQSGVRLSDVARRVEQMGKRAVQNGVRELNSGGKQLRASMIPVLANQAGLKVGTIQRFLHAKEATDGSPIYELRGSGGDIRLKFFRPKESGKGVTAFPRGQAVTVGGAFMRGGSLINRVPLKIAGGRGVFQREGKGRLPIHTVHSGVYIAEEMTKGRTLQLVETSAARIGAQIIRAFTSERL